MQPPGASPSSTRPADRKSNGSTRHSCIYLLPSIQLNIIEACDPPCVQHPETDRLGLPNAIAKTWTHTEAPILGSRVPQPAAHNLRNSHPHAHVHYIVRCNMLPFQPVGSLPILPVVCPEVLRDSTAKHAQMQALSLIFETRVGRMAGAYICLG
jgi:hypothetical protein